MGWPFSRPMPTWDKFLDTWKHMGKPLEFGLPVLVAETLASGRSSLPQSWAPYVQSRPSVVQGIHCMMFIMLSRSFCVGMPTRGVVAVVPTLQCVPQP